MDSTKVLVITHEMDPYVILSEHAKIARQLPEKLQEKEMEVRVFMPRFGKINERKHRLHEVIRLSGINISVGEDDYPMMIKVASLPSARMQVYFIDNEDLFQRKFYLNDKEGNFFKDNDERMIFFNKGAVEILLKLGWMPDIIHCHGWMTSLIPLLARTKYNNEPAFSKSKIFYTAYDRAFEGKLTDNMISKAHIEELVETPEVKELLANPTAENLAKIAGLYSDAVTLGSDSMQNGIVDYFVNENKDLLKYVSPEADNFVDSYYELYSKHFEEQD